MLEILFAITAGVFTGALTGMIPGIHPNTVIFTFLPFYFILNPDFILFMSFISGLTVSHTLHDFLPALFLKAPEAENALASIPGLEMVADGEGRKAFILTLIGGLSSIYVFLIALPILFLIVSAFYPVLERAMAYILIFFLIFIVLESGDILNSILVMALSGSLGLITLNSGFQQQFILMPVFAGLFAVPALSYSLTQEFGIPEQKNRFKIEGDEPKNGATGFAAGLLAGLVPGIGAAISTTFLAPLMNSDGESFMTGLGGVNTSDILISFLALYLIGKPRTGSSVALETVSDVRFIEVGFLIGACIFASGIAGILALKNLDLFLDLVENTNFQILGLLTISVIMAVVGFTTGLYGFLVFGVSSFIGFIALLKGVWASCMAVLIFPALQFFSGGFI